MDKNTYYQEIAEEFIATKKKINGRSRESIEHDFVVLADSAEEPNEDGCWIEIDINDCDYIQMVYVDFNEEWNNANVACDNVTVLGMDKPIGKSIMMHEVMQKIAEHALEGLCEWMVCNGADRAVVWHEQDKVAGIEFSVTASDGQEWVGYADLRGEDLEDMIDIDGLDGWMDWMFSELNAIYENYNVDDEVLVNNIDHARKVGVRAVLESCE